MYIVFIFGSLYLRLGETCSHVGAMLYKIEAAIRVGLTGSTPTGLPCKWNENSVRSITGSPIADINLYTEKTKEKISGQKLTSSKTTSIEQKKQFLIELESVQPKAVCLYLFSWFGESFKCIKPINALKMLPSMREYFNPKNNYWMKQSFNKFALIPKKRLCSMMKIVWHT